MLNKKGFTIAEVLVSFSLITVILLSIVGSTVYYRDKLKMEEVKSQLVDYKNGITKIIYDDIINNHARRVETCLGEANCVNIIDEDLTIHNLRIYRLDESRNGDIRGSYLIYDGVKYFLPDSDLLGRDKDGNIVRTCDFTNGIRFSYYNDLYTIKISFGHSDYDIHEDIMLTVIGGKDEYSYDPPAASTLVLADERVILIPGGSSKTNSYTYNGNGIVECVSSNPDVATCSVDKTNKTIVVTPVAIGSSTITVTATPTSNFAEPEPVSFIVDVNKNTSTLTVANPTVNLTYGTNGSNGYTYDGNGIVGCLSSDTTKVTCSVDTANKKINLVQKTVTTTAVTITVSATETDTYFAPTSQTFSVNVGVKVLVANTPSCSNKTYNGNTTASCTITYSNVASGDSITGGATCTFNNKNVGTGKTVTCTSFTKSGTNSGNYSVPTGSKTTTANITAKTLTASTPTSCGKTYNGNTTAPCTTGISGIVSGDTVSATATCTFVDKNVGTGKTVTCKSYSISGTDSGNYTAPSGNKTTTANITAKTLTASTPTSCGKTYNGNTTAPCTTGVSGVVSGDTVSSTATCTFADANVGTGKTVTCTSYSISGTDSGNYIAPSGNKTTTANITAQACSAPTNVSISTAGKVTWTASSNCSSAQHQVSINNSSWTNASSGVDYKSTIIGATGTRTVYVRAVAPNTNYSTSSSGSGSTTVYSVTLTKGTGIASVTGAGNYIKGSTATINATMSDHYIWKNWTGTPATTTQNYSAAVNGNWSATANTTYLCDSTTDNPSCGNYGTCSVTCSQQTGTKTGTCTHKYYSTVSGYTSHLCSTGSSYSSTVSCNGATTCKWLLSAVWDSTTECVGIDSRCKERCPTNGHLDYSCTNSGSSAPSQPHMTTGKYCWCLDTSCGTASTCF